MAFMEKFQHLKIQLQDILLATNYFDEKHVIGNGGFGKVYRGVLSHSKGRSMAAFKRLDPKLGQGNPEFLKEIVMLSRNTHENLISLLGFCDERPEKILIYEYAVRGSLDRYIKESTLTWNQRLKICIEAAKGLSYLHDPKETHQRIIHCDIKSANILLDENWNAKISDLGLSKIGPANQPSSFLISEPVGTFGYCDPLYIQTGVLTKESDVYSFGVLLIELMCGRLCFEKKKGEVLPLVAMWKARHEKNKLNEIIFNELKKEISPTSLKVYSEIAYQCLEIPRPSMDKVGAELEIALELHNIYEKEQLQKKKIEIAHGYEEQERYKLHEEIIRTVVPPAIYRSKDEMYMLLSKGFPLNGGKTWFSLEMQRDNCEMISIAECLISNPSGSHPERYSFGHNSRFPMGSYVTVDGHFKTHVKARLLSPNITYTVNLVFKFTYQNRNALKKPTYAAFRYKMNGETKSSISYLADGREDGWLMAELYQFISNSRSLDLKIVFEGSTFSMVVDAIDFRPVKKVEHEVLENEKMDIQSVSNSDIYWEQKLPNDYNEIIMSSTKNVQWTTNKELYFLLCKGFQINNGEEWFSLDQNGKNCHMLSARTTLLRNQWTWKSLPESRFEEVAFDPVLSFSIVCKITSQILTPQTEHAIYLVYKISASDSRFDAPVKVKEKDSVSTHSDVTDFRYIYLRSPQTPFIRQKANENSHVPLTRPKIEGLPSMRNDGWMEVQIWKFRTGSTTESTVSMHIDLISSFMRPLNGLIVQGIDFRPLS